MDNELLQMIAASAKLNKLQISIFEEMEKNNQLNEVQKKALDESRKIFRNQVKQLQSYRDKNENFDIEDLY